mgnify:CR=1 FL=1
MSRPVILEAAINGVTPQAKNANVPVAPEEIAADALACLDAGASIVHNHVDQLMVPGPVAAAGTAPSGTPRRRGS